MFSVRSFARSAPRAATRMTSSALRSPALKQASFIQAALKSSSSQYVSSFSTSSSRKANKGDEELIIKLDSEVVMENEMKEESAPASIQEYIENGPFEVIDVPGEEDVVLTRTYGDET